MRDLCRVGVEVPPCSQKQNEAEACFSSWMAWLQNPIFKQIRVCLNYSAILGPHNFEFTKISEKLLCIHFIWPKWDQLEYHRSVFSWGKQPTEREVVVKIGTRHLRSQGWPGEHCLSFLSQIYALLECTYFRKGSNIFLFVHIVHFLSLNSRINSMR